MIALALSLATILLAPSAATAVQGSVQAPPCAGSATRWEVKSEAGLVLEEGPCREGRPEGRWIYRHDNGVVAAEGTFTGGERDGRWVFRFPNGSVASEGAYVGGLEHGPWVERSGTGDVEEGTYSQGERVGSWDMHTNEGASLIIDYADDEPAELHAATAPGR